MTETCPQCGTDSEYIWRCSTCGKLFDGDNEGTARGEGVGRQ